MDALFEARELVFQPPGDDAQAEVQEMPEDFLEPELGGGADLGVLGGDKAGEVDVEVGLECGVFVEVGQDLGLVGVFLERQVDADVVGGQVADVGEQGHLAVDDDLGDLLDEVGLVDVVGDGGDLEGLGGLGGELGRGLGGGAESDAAAAGLVDLAELVLGVDDLAAGGEVGSLDGVVGHELEVFDLGVGQEFEAGLDGFGEVVGGDVGGHAHGDAGAAVDQEVGQPGGQDDGLGLGPVVVGPEGHGVVGDVVE